MEMEISICFCPAVCPDVVIPGEFRNLQLNLKLRGEFEPLVRTIFCAARACFCYIKGFCKPVPNLYCISGSNDYSIRYE